MRQHMNFWMLMFFGLPPVLALAIAYGFVKTGAGTEISADGRQDPEPAGGARPRGCGWWSITDPRDRRQGLAVFTSELAGAAAREAAE
jgi:hypothetical protein